MKKQMIILVLNLFLACPFIHLFHEMLTLLFFSLLPIGKLRMDFIFLITFRAGYLNFLSS